MTASSDFKLVADLLTRLARVQNDLASEEADFNKEYATLISDVRDKVIALQGEEQGLLGELETIATAHPEWFATAKSVKTLTGVIKFHASTTTEVADNDLTFAALEREEKAALKDHRVFFADDYIRTKREPNLDALATLDDETLARLGVIRVPNNTFKATPAAVDLGKAVKEATAEEAA